VLQRVAACCSVLQRVVVCAIASCISLLYRDTCLRLTGMHQGRLKRHFVIGGWLCALVWVEIRSTSTHRRSTDRISLLPDEASYNRESLQANDVLFGLSVSFLSMNAVEYLGRLLFAHIRTYTHMRIRTYTYIHAYKYAHSHTHTHRRHSSSIWGAADARHLHTDIHIYTHTHIQIYTHKQIQSYTHTHIHTYTHTHIHTYTHTHIHTYIHTHM